MREYIERFHNLSLMCPAGMPLPMLLQTCRHNFLDRVKIHMRAVKLIHGRSLWSKLRQPRNRLRSLSPRCLKTSGGVNTKGRDVTQPSQSKEKKTMAVELLGAAQPKQKSSTNNNQEFKFSPKVYSFKDEQVVTVLHLPYKGNKHKLPKVRRPNEVGRINILTTAFFIG